MQDIYYGLTGQIWMATSIVISISEQIHWQQIAAFAIGIFFFWLSNK